jgi:hypothetical protein
MVKERGSIDVKVVKDNKIHLIYPYMVIETLCSQGGKIIKKEKYILDLFEWQREKKVHMPKKKR